MAVKRYRYPITSHMVLQSRHDILVRAAENKADAGGTRLRDKRSIPGDSGTVVEKALQGEVELHRGKKGGGGRVDVRIEDIGEEASVSAARLDAAMHVRLTVGAVRDAAVGAGCPPCCGCSTARAASGDSAACSTIVMPTSTRSRTASPTR